MIINNVTKEKIEIILVCSPNVRIIHHYLFSVSSLSLSLLESSASIIPNSII